MDTSFSIAFATLFAQLVGLKDGAENKNLPDYITMADDLNEALDTAHRDGTLKNKVRENVSEYIIKDPAVVKGISYLKHDKKLFIVTNSDFKYAKLLLDYTINPFLKGGKTWQDLFEFTIVPYARKPTFFFSKEPFLKVNFNTAQTTPHVKKLTPGIYLGGNANKFTTDLGLAAEEILYIGDHIYGDIVRLKKDCAWRTALVVEELDQEIKSIQRARPYVSQINTLMAKKVPLEIKIDELISNKIESGKDAHGKKIEELIRKSTENDKKISPLIKKQNKLFNPYWGEIMRVGIEESYFAYQADVCWQHTRPA